MRGERVAQSDRKSMLVNVTAHDLEYALRNCIWARWATLPPTLAIYRHSSPELSPDGW
jgi:hypothetical protein